jgi:integrase/recombinase XerD
VREQVEQFLRYLKDEKEYSENTIAAYRNDLGQFMTLLDQTMSGSARSWTEVDQELIQAYGAHLADEDYASSTVARKVASVKSFFSFMLDSNLVTDDPTVTLSAPKVEKQSPRVLSMDEIERLLAEPAKGTTAKAQRDRALMELLYATGMRVSEVISLRLEDLDLGQNHVYCASRDGTERQLPLTPRAREALSQYVEKGRDALLQTREETTLFVNQRGRPLTRQGLWLIIKSYAEAAGLGPDITPHTIRHSCAAHRLARGSDLQEVRELLGHANISTTQVYVNMANPLDGESEPDSA